MKDLRKYIMIAGDKHLASWVHGIEKADEAKKELKILRNKIK